MEIENILTNIKILANKANKAGLFDLEESMAIGETIIELNKVLTDYKKIKEDENKTN